MKKLSVLIVILFFQNLVYSDEKNDDKKNEAIQVGPHSGLIQAVGPFNIEIISQKNEAFDVYLLDADLKNETVKNSTVDIFVKAGNVESEMSCLPVENYFSCKQNGKHIKKGELMISSKRDGVRVEELKLKFPIKIEKQTPVKASDVNTAPSEIKK